MRAEMGCDANPSIQVPEHLRYVYDLGGYETMRCPLATSGTPYVQAALDLYADYKNHQTPNGRGVRHETAAYRNAMRALGGFEAKAESWHLKQKKSKGKGGD